MKNRLSICILVIGAMIAIAACGGDDPQGTTGTTGATGNTGSGGLPTLSLPVFTPPEGTYQAAQAVTIQCTNAGAAVWYTSDGSDPVGSGSRTLYTTPVQVPLATTLTLRAVAMLSNWNSSQVVQAVYVVEDTRPQSDAPQFTPPAGVYGSVQSVAISTTNAGAVLWYTTDGSDPASAVTRTEFSTNLVVRASLHLRAIALKDGMRPSGTVDATYVIISAEAPAWHFEYTNDSGVMRVIRYTNTFREIRVPAQINFQDVKEIGWSVFATNHPTAIILPDSVTMILDSAFYGLTNLRFFAPGDGLKSIGAHAFEECRALESLALPMGLTNVGARAFSFLYGAMRSLVIPDSVTHIGDQAFFVGGFQSVTLSSGLQAIGMRAFVGNADLATVTVRATNPPVAGTNLFHNEGGQLPENLQILVPAGSVDAYKAAAGWSPYASRIFAIP
jgi:hypothetical protein